MFHTAAKVVDALAGTHLASSDDDTELEDQPVVEEETTIGDLIQTQVERELVPIPVGLVQTYIYDPQDDLDKLTPIFGTFKGMEEKMVFTCPNCDNETYQPLQTLDMEEECSCSECDYVDTIDAFYDGKDEHHKLINTSRVPSEDEVNMLLYGTTDELPWMADYDSDRQKLKELFGLLHGVDGTDVTDHIPADTVIVRTHHCSEQCKATNCRCQTQGAAGLAGRLKVMDAEDFDNED